MTHPPRRASALAFPAAALLLLLAGALVCGEEPVVHSGKYCGQCHVPHGATGDNSQVPLWNPAYASTTLTGNYTSPTMNATTGAPDGASLLCLSCHDGTYAMSGDFTFGGSTSAHMGTLAVSHPISFVYDQALAEVDGALVDPRTLASDVLDGQGKMQCTSCHDVHAQAVDKRKMLRWSTYDPVVGDNPSTGFCRHCHLK